MAPPTPAQIESYVRRVYDIARLLLMGLDPASIEDDIIEDVVRTRGWDEADVRPVVSGIITAAMTAGGGPPPPGHLSVPPAPPGGAVAPYGPYYLGHKYLVVNILKPDPHKHFNVPLNREPSSGQTYHEKLEFDAHVTGGTPPFEYKWLVSRNGGAFRHFWMYDNDGNAVVFNSPSRDHRFYKGGEMPGLRNNFHFVEPVSNTMNDPWASLPEGNYQVKVNVTDAAGMEARAVTTFTVGGMIPDKAFIRAHITSPAQAGGWKEIELFRDISSGTEWHEPVTFDCEVGHGVTPYKYEWSIDGAPVPEGTGTGPRFKKFVRGGQTYPVATLDVPFASLAEGRHSVQLKVTDRVGNSATSFVNLVVTLKARGKLHAIITQPQKTEGKDMPEFPLKDEPSTKRKYHDPINFDCEVAGGSGNYEYKWTAEALDQNLNPIPGGVVIPLNFVSRKSFTRGGPTHPVENTLAAPLSNRQPSLTAQDPEASLDAGLYKIKLDVRDINGNQTATSETWIRVGDVGAPTPRSRSSYLGGPDWLGRPAVRVGGGITGPYSPTAGMGYVKRNAVTGGLERARYRVQNPMAGIGRGFSTSDDRFGKENTTFKGDKVRGGTVSKNPAIQAAINQAKRDLNRWARSLSRPVFAKKQAELAKMTKIWSDARKQWVDVRKKARRRTGGWSSFKGAFKGKGTGDAVLAAIAMSSLGADEQRMISEEVQRTYNAFTKADNDLMNFSHQAQIDMENEINNIFTDDFVASIAKRAAFKYKVTDRDVVDYITAEIKIEKESLVSHLIATGKDRFGGPVGALRSASLSAKTIGSGYFGFLTALRLFIFGPWTISTIFVILQFFFVFTYVGYVPQILYIMPIIAGAFVFLLNFADTMRPLDWVTHFMSGAMIGYSAALLLIALGAHTWSFIGGTNTFAFWIAWLILSFIGVFQFYQTGD